MNPLELGNGKQLNNLKYNNYYQQKFTLFFNTAFLFHSRP